MKVMNAGIIIVVLGLAASWSASAAGTGDVTPKPVKDIKKEISGAAGPMVGSTRGPELQGIAKRSIHTTQSTLNGELGSSPTPLPTGVYGPQLGQYFPPSYPDPDIMIGKK